MAKIKNTEKVIIIKFTDIKNKNNTDCSYIYTEPPTQQATMPINTKVTDTRRREQELQCGSIQMPRAAVHGWLSLLLF